MAVFVRVFYHYHCRGRELIPEGPAIICAPHSSLIDPVLVAVAMGIKQKMNFMAKKELMKHRVVGWTLRKLGAFFVARGTADVTAVKTTIKHLRDGHKVLIFPEGKRTDEADYSAAKNGAVRIAARTGVPIIPVYIPRNKRFFRRTELIIGQSYFIQKPGPEDDQGDYYAQCSQELMRKLEELGR